MSKKAQKQPYFRVDLVHDPRATEEGLRGALEAAIGNSVSSNGVVSVSTAYSGDLDLPRTFREEMAGVPVNAYFVEVPVLILINDMRREE